MAPRYKKNRNRRRRRARRPSDKMSARDRWAFIMGWLWSFQGLLLVVSCALGLMSGIHKLTIGLHNDPIQIAGWEGLGLDHEEAVVAVTLPLDLDDAAILEQQLTGKDYTLAPVVDSQRRLFVFMPGLHLAEDDGPVERSVTGQLFVARHGTAKLHGLDVSLHKAYGYEASAYDDALIISDSEVPEASPELWAVVLLCLIGLGYVIVQTVRAAVYAYDQERFLARFVPSE